MTNKPINNLEANMNTEEMKKVEEMVVVISPADAQDLVDNDQDSFPFIYLDDVLDLLASQESAFRERVEKVVADKMNEVSGLVETKEFLAYDDFACTILAAIKPATKQ